MNNVHRFERRTRGLALIEILVVVAIMSLLAAGIGVAAYTHFENVKGEHAVTTAKALRHAVQAYWLSSPESECPTVSELARAATIDEDSSPNDPWGSPWSITCSGSNVLVSSPGPDKTPNTQDDVRVPQRSSIQP